MLEELEGDFLEVVRYREYFHRIILIRKCCCGTNCDSHMAWGGLNLKLHFVHVPMKELDIKTSPWSVEIWNSPWLVGWSVGGSAMLSRKIMNMTSRTVLRRMVHSSLMRCLMVEKNHHTLAAQFQVTERKHRRISHGRIQHLHWTPACISPAAVQWNCPRLNHEKLKAARFCVER